MNQPFCSFFKPGIILPMAFPSIAKGDGPIVESVRRIAYDAYFHAVELTWINDAETRRQVRKLTAEAGMTVAFGAQPMLIPTGLNINAEDEALRVKTVERVKDGILQACEMGAETLTFLSGRYSDADAAYCQLVRSIEELCAFAPAGLKLALEVFDYDVDKKSLIGPVSLAEEIAKELCPRFNNFGITVDLSHIPLIHESFEQSVVPVGDYLVHAHLGNCVMKDPAMPAYGDMHPRFGFPNGENGVGELTEFLSLLLRLGFINTKDRPVVLFEVKPQGDEDAEAVIASSKRALDLAWAGVVQA